MLQITNDRKSFQFDNFFRQRQHIFKKTLQLTKIEIHPKQSPIFHKITENRTHVTGHVVIFRSNTIYFRSMNFKNLQFVGYK